MSTPGRAAARRKSPHVLANAPYRRLWTASAVCGLGDWLAVVALTALAGDLTAGSGYQAQILAVGGMFAVVLLPLILLGPLVGALAHRFDPRATMVLANLARFVVVLSVPLVDRYQWALGAAFLIACLHLLWAPARDTAVPGLVRGERPEEVDRLGLLAAYGTAPAAAVLFAAVSALITMIATAAPAFPVRATDLALGVGALGYLVSGVLLLAMRPVPVDSARVPPLSVPRKIMDGRRSLGRGRTVGRLVTGMLAVLAAGGALAALARPYTQQTLRGGDAGYGTLLGALFTGAALGLFLGLRLLGGLSRRRVFALAIITGGVAVGAFALIHNLVLAVLLAGALGTCAGIAGVIGFTLIGMEVEDGPRGRLLAYLESLGLVTLLLVVVLAAVPAAVLGPHVLAIGEMSYSVDGSTLVLLLAALVVVVVGVRGLRRLDDRPDVSVRADLLAALRGERLAPEESGETPGLFVAFEGGEGSGKTTQSRLLAIWLRDQGFDVVQTREPGSTKVGMRLRAILLDAAHQGLSARAEAMLYAADRAEHVEKVIRPALERGSTVISDRYVDSSLAYQGAGRSLDRDEVVRVNTWATGGLVPDLTVLIDLPPSVGLRRMASPADRIEAEPVEFHERVRREFRSLAAAEPDRYFVVDGTLPQNEVSRLIQDRVREILPDPVPHETEAATGTIPAIRD